MEPPSSKGHDLRERRRYALHNGVPDSQGSGGESWVSGETSLVSDPAARRTAAEAAGYERAERSVLFEPSLEEVRCTGYGNVPLPERTRWAAASG